MFDLTQIIMVVLSVLVGAGLAFGINKFVEWRTNLPKDEEWLKHFIGAACEVAEKMYLGEGRGKEKLAWVLGLVLATATQYGITFDVQKVTDIIDQYVLEVLNAGQEPETPAYRK